MDIKLINQDKTVYEPGLINKVACSEYAMRIFTRYCGSNNTEWIERETMLERVLVGTPLEGEHLHPYTLGTVSEDKCHGKKQIHTRAKDPDCAGINQNQHKHGRTVPQAQCPPTDVS